MNQRFSEIGYRFKTGACVAFERDPFEQSVARDAAYKPPIALKTGDVLEIHYDEHGNVLGAHLSQRVA